MNQAENDDVDRLKAEIEEAQVDLPKELPFALYEKPNNKTTNLLASSTSKVSLDGRNRWYEYKFKELCLVTVVKISIGGYTNYHEFEFIWRNDAERDLKVSGKPENGVLTFVVNDICKRVSFKPPVLWFAQGTIKSVSVEGIKREDIPALLNSLSDLDDLKAEILEIADKATTRANGKLQEAEKASAERTAVNQEIINLKSQQTKLKRIIEDLSNKRNELIAQNSASEDSLKSANQRLRSSNGAVDLADSRLEALNSSIAKSEEELKSLKGNINLFPTEIVEFVNQGSRNIRQYFFLAALPIVLLPIVFGVLIYGAADLSTIFTKDPNYNIDAVILSRIPYVAICLAIITASYKIARAFILEIVKVNNQRLSLTKISIIAKDVSAASSDGLALSDEDTYRLRTDLKMQLLRDHMKEYISKDFKIQLPNQIISALGFGRRAAEKAEPSSLEVSVNTDGASMKVG